ncbi:MAG TPA: hypothetical protein VM942_10345 [Acidimicrobiales bacterium]|nr:hypothetical protein [Acidimicrobiales bacterium]
MGTKLAIWGHVEEQRRVFADTLDAARSSRFAAIKIDGVRESTLSIVVG